MYCKTKFFARSFRRGCSVVSPSRAEAGISAAFSGDAVLVADWRVARCNALTMGEGDGSMVYSCVCEGGLPRSVIWCRVFSFDGDLGALHQLLL